MSFYKKEEKTASDRQVKASVKTMLGILEHNGEITLPKDKEQMFKVLERSIEYLNEWLMSQADSEGNVPVWTSGNTSDVMALSDWSKFDKCYIYKAGAEVEPQGLKYCILDAVTECEHMVSLDAEPVDDKPVTKKPATKKKKATRKPIAEVKPKTKGKPALSVKVKDNDKLLDACAELGVDEDDFLKLLALAGKAS